MSQFRTKRVYDVVSTEDGFRVLVDRLWPRGLTKAQAHIDLWLKDVAPSHDLRKAFHAGGMPWNAFLKAYEEELSQEPAKSAVRLLVGRTEKTITLLFSSKEIDRNNATVLAAWLEKAKAAT